METQWWTTWLSGSRSWRVWFVQITMVGLAYYGSAKIGGLLNSDLKITPIWPPTGIALVAMLVGGYRIWPAVALSAFALNLSSHSVGTAALIAIGNTLAPMFGVLLLRSVGFSQELNRLRDAFALVFFGSLVPMTVSASIGTLALWLQSSKGLSLLSSWTSWWVSDATGTLAFAPLLLIAVRVARTGWRNIRGKVLGPNIGPAQLWFYIPEGVLLLAGLLLVGHFVFTEVGHYGYLVFPFLIWAAARFSLLGSAVTTLALISEAVATAGNQSGTFFLDEPTDQLLRLQTFNAVITLSSFLLAAAMAERTRAHSETETALHLEQSMAETLQRALLPEQLPHIPNITIAVRYFPAVTGLEVGGDWYDAFLLPNGKVGITIGDVEGKGLGAATTMGQLRSSLRAYALQTSSPATALERLSYLAEETKVSMMATIIYAILDPDTGKLVFDNAGHLPPLLIDEAGHAEYLDHLLHSVALGIGAVPHDETEITLEPGMTFFLYTDGLVERHGEVLDEGLERLKVSVEGNTTDPESLCTRVLEAAQQKPFEDDVAILAIRWAGSF